MNPDSKIEIEELFSAALDGELTQRQQTELKRLLQHQPGMAEQLEALRRQRELCCSLPVETAPASLAEDVRARLERKLILDNASRTQSLRGRAALLRRRFVAAAAMLFLPLGLLGVVVYHIVTPRGDEPSGQPTANELLRDDLLLTIPAADIPAAVAALPFDGVLTLMTEQPMPAAQSIKKQIFLQSMEERAIPHQTADVITFQIDCPAAMMAEFVGSLAPLWRQITHSRLELRDADAPERTVTVEHVRAEQIQRLVRFTDKTPMLTAARQYASSNVPLRQGGAAAEDVMPTPGELVIPQPFLAWPQRDEPLPAESTTSVRLTIEIRRAE